MTTTLGLARQMARLVPGAEIQLQDMSRTEVRRVPPIEKAGGSWAGNPRSASKRITPDTGLVQGIRSLMKIAVIGAGKMGLPLACQFASRGEPSSRVTLRPWCRPS